MVGQAVVLLLIICWCSFTIGRMVQEAIDKQKMSAKPAEIKNISYRV